MRLKWRCQPKEIWTTTMSSWWSDTHVEHKQTIQQYTQRKTKQRLANTWRKETFYNTGEIINLAYHRNHNRNFPKNWKINYHITQCGGMNENDPHRLIGSSTIRRSGFVEGRILLGLGFAVSNTQARPSGSFFLLPAIRCRTLSCLSSTMPTYVAPWLLTRQWWSKLLNYKPAPI